MFWRLTLSVKMHAGLFWHFHTPLNYKFFNMHMWSFCICMCTWGTSSEGCLFCRDCTEFDSREIFRQAQCVAHNGHQPMRWPHLIMQKLAFDSEERLPSDSDVAFKIIKTLTCECVCVCVCVCACAHMSEERGWRCGNSTHTHKEKKKRKESKTEWSLYTHWLTAGKLEMRGSMMMGMALMNHFMVWFIVPAFIPSTPSCNTTTATAVRTEWDGSSPQLWGLHLSTALHTNDFKSYHSKSFILGCVDPTTRNWSAAPRNSPIVTYTYIHVPKLLQSSTAAIIKVPHEINIKLLYFSPNSSQTEVHIMTEKVFLIFFGRAW